MMRYTTTYTSPLGEILLAADDTGLTGLWFMGAKYFAAGLEPGAEERDLPVFHETKRWLDGYFSGREPDFLPPLHLSGTPFQMAVWKVMGEIPYGKTMTYGEIARRLGCPRASQAVGSAVGRNPISVILPCHRVVGSSGSLTGYAGGMEKKVWLLDLEKADRTGLFVPGKGSRR